MSDRPANPGGRRIVKVGRRRAVSSPQVRVEPQIDPTLDDRLDQVPGSQTGSGPDRSHDDWLQAQRPPHWE